jgi:hypothetical protein
MTPLLYILAVLALYFFPIYIIGRIASKKKIGAVNAILISLFFTPFIGLIASLHSGLKNPIGCKHCGNSENEVEFCALCGKNESGEIQPGFNEHNEAI